jgi:hypothetical protein
MSFHDVDWLGFDPWPLAKPSVTELEKKIFPLQQEPVTCVAAGATGGGRGFWEQQLDPFAALVDPWGTEAA